MKACCQFENINMIDHGNMVHHEYNQMISKLEDGDHDELILQQLYPFLKPLLMPSSDIETYQMFHDCGKPFCTPDDGKKYPDHAEHSYNQWLTLYPESTTIAELMRYDMVFHEGAPDDFYSHRLAPTLYLTAWAEIYANCQMFGGQDSTSFKIKRKKLIQQGKKFLKHFTA